MGRDSNKPHGIIDPDDAISMKVSDKLYRDIEKARAEILKIINEKGHLSDEDAEKYIDMFIGEDTAFGLPLNDVAHKIDIWKRFFEKESLHIISLLDDLRSAIATPERVALIQPRFIIIAENPGCVLDSEDNLRVHLYNVSPSEALGMLTYTEVIAKEKILSKLRRRSGPSPLDIVSQIFGTPGPQHPEDEDTKGQTPN